MVRTAKKKKNIVEIIHKTFPALNIALAAYLLLLVAKIAGIDVYLDTVKERAVAVIEKQDADHIVSECKGQALTGCYRDKLVNLINKHNFSYALKTLAFIQQEDPATRPCHVLAHYMARAAVAKHPQNWLELLDVVKISDCGGGFLHGIFEGYMGFDPSFELTINSANTICGRYKSDPEKIMSCYHWFGHVFMLDERGNLESSLPRCVGAIPQQYSFNCYDGVFMEFIYQHMLLDHGISTSLNISQEYITNILIPTCLKYAGTTEGVACWTEVGEPHMNVSDFDPAYARDGCKRAPSDKERLVCYEKAETIIALQPKFSSPELLVNVCERFREGESEDGYRDCLRHMIGGFAHYPPDYATRAITLCTYTRAAYRMVCFQSVGNSYTSVGYSLQDRKRICKDVEDEFKSACVGPQ
mgnify:CR=1 FL=1